MPAVYSQLRMADSIEAVRGDGSSVAAIGVTAGRIRRFAEAVQQGHQFGIAPGDHDEPWTFDFQRIGVEVYSQTLPWTYLTTLATAFADCADLMSAVQVPETISVEWLRMHSYLTAAAKAIHEAAPGTIESDELASAEDIDPRTPPVMPFGKLAGLMSAKGAADLAAIGVVEDACDQHDYCPITEQEKEWLRRLRDGDRTIDIAIDHGYSERSLYRALSELWERLEVDNRREAIGLAMKNQWID